MGIRQSIAALFKRSPAQPSPRVVRAFGASGMGRLLSDWMAWDTRIDWDIFNSLQRLRARARQLEQNNALAQKYLSLVEDNIPGPHGFRLQVRGVDSSGETHDRANNKIEANFARWGRQCDLTHLRDWPEIQRACARGLARDGEALIRFHETAQGLRLEMLDPDRLDHRKNDDGSNRIRLGIEYNQQNQPINYYLLTAPRSVSSLGYAIDQQHEVVPASDIVHLYLPQRAEQGRGAPWMAPVMQDIHMLEGYDEAALVAARVGASKMGFFTSPDGTPASLGTKTTSDSGNTEEFLDGAEPGEFDVLPEGYKFEAFTPDYPHQNYPDFTKAHIRRIASGLGVSYTSIANDLENVNFSSIRAGVLDERQHWMRLQDWFADKLLRRVYDRWLTSATLRGESGILIDGIERYRAHIWMGRRWAWVDPLKDMQSAALAISLGVRTRTQIASEQGLDYSDVIQQLARELDEAKKLGVNVSPGSLKPDTNLSDQSGGTQNAPKTAAG